MSLQHQLTIVHHQSSPPIVSQNGTDQSDLMDCISALRNEVRQLKEDNQQRKSLMQSSSQFAMSSQYNIATPVIPVTAGSPFITPHASIHAASPYVPPNQSACAGYVPQDFMNMSPKRPQPPGQPGTPPSSTSSRPSDPGRGKGVNTPLSTHDPSWRSNPGDGSGVGGSPIARRWSSVGWCRFCKYQWWVVHLKNKRSSISVSANTPQRCRTVPWLAQLLSYQSRLNWQDGWEPYHDLVAGILVSKCFSRVLRTDFSGNASSWCIPCQSADGGYIGCIVVMIGALWFLVSGEEAVRPSNDEHDDLRRILSGRRGRRQWTGQWIRRRTWPNGVRPRNVAGIVIFFMAIDCRRFTRWRSIAEWRGGTTRGVWQCEWLSG